MMQWDGLAVAKWVQRGGDLDGEAAGDELGRSVALSNDGTVLAVGAAYNDGAGADAGHVRVFVLDASTNEWVRRGGDLDGDAAGDRSGWSVALSGDGTVLAVGAPKNDGAGDDAGHVRVYAWDNLAAEWVQRGDDLFGKVAGDSSGWSVALSSNGTTLVVGAPYNDGAGDLAGQVRVYAWDALTVKWVQRGEDLFGEVADDYIGWSVALSGDGTVLAVGAPLNDSASGNNGNVRVYAWDSLAAKWVQRGEDLDGKAAEDRSGFSVALSNDGTVLAVGAPYNDDSGTNAGHVRVYAWYAPASNWVQRGNDLNGEAAGDRSGWSVALSSNGTVLAVGSPYKDETGDCDCAGHVRVHAWDAPAGRWVRRGDDLDGEAAGDFSGHSVALSGTGTVLAVGALYNDNTGDRAGHARVYLWEVANKP